MPIKAFYPDNEAGLCNGLLLLLDRGYGGFVCFFSKLLYMWREIPAAMSYRYARPAAAYLTLSILLLVR